MASTTVTFAWGIVLGHNVLLFQFVLSALWITARTTFPLLGQLFSAVFNTGLGTAVYNIHKYIVARPMVKPKGWVSCERVLKCIRTCKWVSMNADGSLCVPACCTYWCMCAQSVSLTCHLAAWWCSRTPGSAEKTRWLQSAASHLPWGPDPGWLTPGCVGKQTRKGLSKHTMPASVNMRPRHQHCKQLPSLSQRHQQGGMIYWPLGIQVSGCYSWKCHLTEHHSVSVYCFKSP